MNLIEELYALQEAHGYLREDDLRALSRRTQVPLYEIEGVSTFYPHFRRTAPPKWKIIVYDMGERVFQLCSMSVLMASSLSGSR